MASRYFHEKQYANEFDVVSLYCKLTFAADTEADGNTVTRGPGIASAARTAEGTVRLTLSDAYPAFLGIVSCGISKADTTLQFSAEDVDGSTPYVDFKTITAASAADADSATIYLCVKLRNSSVA